ncbi:MAG: RHS repeat-associated core domain-containing protein, partial [Bdellovibrionota bacterium]
SYDAMARRAAKIVGEGESAVATFYLLDGNREVQERNASGGITQEYTFGIYIDEPLTLDKNTASDDTCIGSGDTRYYYHQNTLYSVYALTDADGGVKEAYFYDPYGRPYVISDGVQDQDSIVNFNGDDDVAKGGTSASAVGNPFLFTGRRRDEEVYGQYYYRARYLDWEMGRFAGRDSFAGNIAINLYEYVSSRPVIRMDPNGMEETNGSSEGAVDAGSVGTGGPVVGGGGAAPITEVRSGEVVFSRTINQGPLNSASVTVRTGVALGVGGIPFALRDQRNYISIKYEGTQECSNCCWVQFIWTEMKMYNVRGVTRKTGAIKTSGGTYNFTTDPDKPNWSVDSASGSIPCYDKSGVHARDATSVTIYDRPKETFFGLTDTEKTAYDKIENVDHFDSYFVCGKNVKYKVSWTATSTRTRVEGMRGGITKGPIYGNVTGAPASEVLPEQKEAYKARYYKK